MAPRKQKQKQKQTQKQSVVVNIHDKPKKRRARKKKAPAEPLPPPVVLGLPKVPPIVIQYSDPASLVAPPQPPRQEPARQEPARQEPPQAPPLFAPQRIAPIMGEQRRENILQGIRQEVERPPAREEAARAAIRREAEVQVEIPEPPRPIGLQARPSAREAAIVAAEQRAMFERQARPASDILQPAPAIAFQELVAEAPRIQSQRAEEERQQELVFAEPVPLAGGAVQIAERVEEKGRTSSARRVRQALQRSQGKGSDVPTEFLLLGIYNLDGQPRRSQPTYEQRVRMFEEGAPYKGDEQGVAEKPRRPKSKRVEGLEFSEV
jgi:hypothetical protein